MENNRSIAIDRTLEQEINGNSIVIDLCGRLRGTHPELRLQIIDSAIEALLDLKTETLETPGNIYPSSYEPVPDQSNGLRIK